MEMKVLDGAMMYKWHHKQTISQHGFSLSLPTFPLQSVALFQKFTKINYLRALFLKIEIRITISSAALFFDFVKTSIPKKPACWVGTRNNCPFLPAMGKSLLVFLLHPIEPGRHHQAQELRKEDQFHRVHSSGVF